MTTLEVGKQLVSLCNKGQNDKVYDTLYDPNIVSVEAQPGAEHELRGIDAVKEKSRMWNDHHIVHSETVDGPYPNGDRFAVRFKFDLTDKDTNQRQTFEETAIYTVANDKIIREEFFYAT
ncbi:MAG TPA: nuclear transport factor 2 family protein [Kofleriaceae bacterium]|nr:nuclear transport factor 2 family protein [Kofleriaceae bacterium]